MKKTLNKILVSAFLMTGIQLAHGQTSDFTPGGKPVFLLFSNVNYSFNKDGNSPEFEITRLYLGYEYSFSRNFSARANFDVGDPGVGGLQMTAYVKNAFLQYKTDDFSARMGMIGTDQYNLIEKQWGYRYIFKTLQDEYGFGPSADMGAAAEYKPSELAKVNILLNGDQVDALSFIAHKDTAYPRARKLCEKLRDNIPRQLFEIPIQAAIGGRIIARETVKALRKDVLAKCYGGDITRKKKLLEKQKEGKKKMRQLGTVQIPTEAFLAVLKLDD
jgi:hypothetical protein